MKFSVIIATIHREEELIAMLNSLLAQSFKNFEVIVVDQNENNLIDDHIEKFNTKLHINHIRTTIKGASNARNIGIKNAKGTILTFPDDDCEFYPNFLTEINTYFEQNDIDGIVVSSKDKEDGKAISILMSSKEQLITRKNVLKTVVEFGIIIRKDNLKDTLFDPYLGVGSPISPYWSDEGPDFILQLLEKGLKIRFVPKFFMYHPNPVKKYTEKTIIRSYRYGLGRGYFLKKNNFGISKIGYYLTIYCVGMIKGILFLNKNMFLYFLKGFKGRYEGYFKS